MVLVADYKDNWRETGRIDVPHVWMGDRQYKALLDLQLDAVRQGLRSHPGSIGVYAIKFWAGLVPRYVDKCRLLACYFTKDEYAELKKLYEPYGRDVEICIIR